MIGLLRKARRRRRYLQAALDLQRMRADAAEAMARDTLAAADRALETLRADFAADLEAARALPGAAEHLLGAVHI